MWVVRVFAAYTAAVPFFPVDQASNTFPHDSSEGLLPATRHHQLNRGGSPFKRHLWSPRASATTRPRPRSGMLAALCRDEASDPHATNYVENFVYCGSHFPFQCGGFSANPSRHFPWGGPYSPIPLGAGLSRWWWWWFPRYQELQSFGVWSFPAAVL
jgi:hypothetical protein